MPEELTDHQIAALLRSQDPRVLYYILRRYGGAHQQQWLRSLFRPLDPEDIIAEALCKVWKQGQRYDPEIASFQTWFSWICKNAARDMHRRQKNDALAHQEHISEALGEFRPAHREEVDEENRAVSEDLKGLNRKLEQLSEVDQKIVRGDPQNDHLLAEELGMTPGNIKTRRTRLIKRLRQDLGGDEYDASER